MTEAKLKSIAGTMMLLFHFSAIFSAAILLLADALLFDQFTTIIAIACPVLSVYVTAYISYVVENARAKATRQHRDRTISSEFALLLLSVCSLFGVTTVGLLWIKGLSLFPLSFEQFKGLFAVAEVAIGSLASKLYFSQYR